MNKFLLLKNQSFRSLYIGQTLSEFGGAVGALMNALLLYEITGSKAAMGTLWLLYFIPSLVIQLGAGPFIDRFSRQRLMIVVQMIRFWTFLLPALLYLSGHLELWVLFFIQIVLGIVQPLYTPAGLALLPAILHNEDLVKGNAWMDGTMRLMSFLAPPAGAVLITLTDTAWLYGIVALLFLLSALGLRTLNEPQRTLNVRSSWSSQIQKGYQLFWHHKTLVWLTVFSGLVQFGVGVTLVINIPFIMDELNQSTVAYGWFAGMFPLGYVIGAYLTGKLTLPFSKQRVMFLGLFAGGLSFAGLAVSPNFAFALICELLGGIFFPFFNIHNAAFFQRSVTNEQAGVLFSIRLLIVRLSMPAGIAVGTLLVGTTDMRPLYLLIGLLIMTPALIGFTHPYFSRFSETSSPERKIG